MNEVEMRMGVGVPIELEEITKGINHLFSGVLGWALDEIACGEG